MTFNVKFEVNEVFYLEFENEDEFDQWENNGSVIEEAPIVKSKINTETIQLD